MGQKVNPKDIRIGIIHTWPSRWFANKKSFAKKLLSDMNIRSYLGKKLKEASISRIEIERTSSHVSVMIFSGKPGVIIGRSGDSIENLKKELFRKFGEHFDISVREVKNPDIDARLLADSVARQIEKRVAFRRAAKGAVRKAMEGGAKGVKVAVSGRLGGAEISREEFYIEGKIPLQTFRADIDYAIDRAETTYGTIGIKVWVFKGEIFKNRLEKLPE